ncbi:MULTISPECIES: NAD(P)-dependent oxidoreductase [unclassified Duganella]|uniref:NAD-dependent epimerase/dehydratase family protein n=1 Tax=unclassified Duganella TaxID=2636909 RepID=UPI000E3541EE|nr:MULTISPECIES: NAD(P)-dependent oxidoreductase [unclassified Duganella]RFP08071.1 NAD(P)-dependent oxidoreductase [Duganella sp. BJB475]RFP23876.1 NAD(P)-dependent oxidoreductase [Duganella sp. BJB476]
MKRVAILGASSQIAKDLILSFAREGNTEVLLYVRDTAAAQRWLATNQLDFPVAAYAGYGQAPHDAVLNFVGVGDPQRAAQMGGAIFGVTQEFDDLALRELQRHPERRYIFLSSGAAYNSGFEQPAGPHTKAVININALKPQDYYAVAKLHAECKHRALPDLHITDLRVFNYFSRTQDLGARFFITDLLRAVRDDTVLQTSAGSMVRDYLHPQDFHQLVSCVLRAPAGNRAIDCYSAAPVEKLELLAAMAQRFGLRYEVGAASVVNATGAKPHYYSLNRQAAELGYHPAYSSIDGISAESAIILGRDNTTR